MIDIKNMINDVYEIQMRSIRDKKKQTIDEYRFNFKNGTGWLNVVFVKQ